ncbi:sigma factor-like helix-turn-helix DNA-binding protein [Tsukamurella sp. NPDC003166]|uniref:RNA polymerase sigma factor n=1 Tax=Tsukamurella sp. NPDC003166 TaxID=3154444 RepID=UPI0033A93E02
MASVSVLHNVPPNRLPRRCTGESADQPTTGHPFGGCGDGTRLPTVDDIMGPESPCADARLRAALPPELYRVLRLRVVQRRTVEQTAAALRLSPHAVRIHQHRALETLRADLRSPGRSVLS